MQLLSKHTENIISYQGLFDLIIASGCLGKAERQKKLLQYLIDKHKSNEADEIKAYSIAVDVLDRPLSFDNTIDSIVRVEMHRLRKNLAAFNSGNNTFLIQIPKQTYKIYITPIKQVAPKPKKTFRLKQPVANLALSALLGLTLFTAVQSLFQMQASAVDFTQEKQKSLIRKPKFHIAIQANGDPAIKKNLEAIEDELERYMDAPNKFSYTKAKEADYTITLSFIAETKRNFIKAEAITPKKEVIFFSYYQVDDSPSFTKTTAIDIERDFLGWHGALIMHHASNPENNPETLKVYRVLLDTHRYTTGDPTLYYAPEELYQGLENQAFLSIGLRETVLRYQLRLLKEQLEQNGNLGIRNASKKKEEIEQKLDKYGRSELGKLENEIYNLWVTSKDINLLNERANNLLHDYPFELNAQYAAGNTFAFFTGNFEAGEKLADKLTQRGDTTAHLIYVPRLFLEQKYEEAKFHLEKTTIKSHPTYITIEAAIACSTKNQADYGMIMSKVKKQKPLANLDFQKRLDTLNYFPPFKAALQNALETCPILYN